MKKKKKNEEGHWSSGEECTAAEEEEEEVKMSGTAVRPVLPPLLKDAEGDQNYCYYQARPVFHDDLYDLYDLYDLLFLCHADIL